MQKEVLTARDLDIEIRLHEGEKHILFSIAPHVDGTHPRDARLSQTQALELAESLIRLVRSASAQQEQRKV